MCTYSYPRRRVSAWKRYVLSIYILLFFFPVDLICLAYRLTRCIERESRLGTLRLGNHISSTNLIVAQLSRAPSRSHPSRRRRTSKRAWVNSSLSKKLLKPLSNRVQYYLCSYLMQILLDPSAIKRDTSDLVLASKWRCDLQVAFRIPWLSREPALQHFRMLVIAYLF